MIMPKIQKNPDKIVKEIEAVLMEYENKIKHEGRRALLTIQRKTKIPIWCCRTKSVAVDDAYAKLKKNSTTSHIRPGGD